AGHDWTHYRIRVWNLASGAQLCELRPFEQDTCQAVSGLQWLPDGRHVIAQTRSDAFATGQDLDIWDTRSGRQRATLSGGPSFPLGMIVTQKGSLAASLGSTGDEVSIVQWNLAAAMEKVRTFEASLNDR